MAQCRAVNNNGQRCKNNALLGNNYCRVHNPRYFPFLRRTLLGIGAVVGIILVIVSYTADLCSLGFLPRLICERQIYSIEESESNQIEACSLHKFILGRWRHTSISASSRGEAEARYVGFSTIEFLRDGTFASSGRFHIFPVARPSPTGSPSIADMTPQFSLDIKEVSTNSTQSGTYTIIDCHNLKMKISGENNFDIVSAEELNDTLLLSFMDETSIRFLRQ